MPCPPRRYIKFDTFHPAVDMGLPVTRVISRVTLQEILADACQRVAGDGVITNSVNIVDYEQGPDPVTGKQVCVPVCLLVQGKQVEGEGVQAADECLASCLRFSRCHRLLFAAVCRGCSWPLESPLLESHMAHVAPAPRCFPPCYRWSLPLLRTAAASPATC